MANLKLNSVSLATESGGTVSLDSAIGMPAGHIIQTIMYTNDTQVSTPDTTFSTSNKISFGVITPLFATSDILISGHIATSANANAAYAFVDIYKNASDFTETANLTGWTTGLIQMNDACIWATSGYYWLDTCSENSTSAKTYGLTIRANSSAGSATIGWGGNGGNVMILQEIKR